MSAEQIDVMVVIDTAYIKSNYGPNDRMDNPVGINHNSQYMLCNSPRGVNGGQGTAALSFNADAGDYVSFRACSMQANSDDAVILYGIKHWSRDQVFNTFTSDIVTRNRAVQPDPSKLNGVPPVLTQQNFTSYDTKIARGGTENFYVYIAVYNLAADGQTQELYGYYYWDPQVVVPT